MEKLDIYDEEMNYVGTEDRDVVHSKGLWHKTVHCWIYDTNKNVYFQIRKDSNKLYTTASGHVLAGETIKQAFHREVLEEIGINVETDNSSLVEINAWRMDKLKNGIPFVDRAFANVYINCINKNHNKFKFDENEVIGIVKVNAEDCLKLLEGKLSQIAGEKVTNSSSVKITLTINDFLIFPHEIGLIKYGKILQSIIAEK